MLESTCPTGFQTDRELIRWALCNGWTYRDTDDQLIDPYGYATKGGNLQAIPIGCRQQILQKMNSTLL